MGNHNGSICTSDKRQCELIDNGTTSYWYLDDDLKYFKRFVARDGFMPLSFTTFQSEDEFERHCTGQGYFEENLSQQKYDSIQMFCIKNYTTKENVTYYSFREFVTNKNVSKLEYNYQDGDNLYERYTSLDGRKLVEYELEFVAFNLTNLKITVTSVDNNKVIMRWNDDYYIKGPDAEDFVLQEGAIIKKLRKFFKALINKLPNYMRKNLKSFS